MSEISDVVIIGGGINGVSTAYHLAAQGVKVALLEKSFIAGGPTGWSSAIIRQHYSNPITAKMALDSLHVWQNFKEVIGGDAGFTNTGFLIGVRPEDVAGLQANIEMQQSVGINTCFVSADELKDLEPQLDPTGLGGAAYESEGGYCEPNSAANAFAQAAKRHQAKIHVQVEAQKIVAHGGKVTGVETNQGFFAAEKVVVAAGPWSPHLLAHLGIAVPIITARIKIGLFQRPKHFDRHMIWGDFISQIYLRPETGGMMLIGSISPDEAKDQVENPDSFNTGVDLETLAEFAERSAMRYPVMTQGHLAKSYSSLYDITPDWHPILDSLTGYEGLYICAGGSGHGFKLAPAVGSMMANFVVNGKSPSDPINLFSFERFAAGKPVRGQYEYSILG